MSLFDRLRAAPSAPAPVPKASLVERLGLTDRALRPEEMIVERPRFGGRAVEWSEDLQRILDLPRRPTPDLNALVKKWTSILKTPEGTQTLFPIQAWALEEASAVGGILGSIGVGHGKTLIDCLAPMVVPGCRRAVLFIPPNLRAQFFREWDLYAQHWKLPNLAGGRSFVAGRPVLHVVAYSELSSPKSSDLLERLRPDLILADEAYSLRRKDAARTKRFLRYFEAHPEVRFAAWTGTFTSKSLKDYAHLSRYALHKSSPVPLKDAIVDEWAAALDPVLVPAPIGALRHLCRPGEDVRSGYRRRLRDTLGFVATEEGSVSASLVLSERKPPPVPNAVVEAIEGVRSTWQRPDGEELIDGLSVARCARELACGFFLRWRWPRGEPEDVILRWLERRKAWHKELREKLKYGGEHLDSPLLCAKAAIRYYERHSKTIDEKISDRESAGHALPLWRAETWPAWVEVRETAKPETEVVWVDDFLMRDAAEWGRKNVGIIWYDSDAVGKKIAELSGLPHYGPGVDASARILEEKGDRSIIASIRSHGTGKNLQPFSRNLIVQTPSSGATMEQLLGRTHRTGQAADEIEAFVYRHTFEMAAALDSAIRDAEYISETLGTKQKLVYASRTF